MPDTFEQVLEKRKTTAVAIFHRFRLEVATGLDKVLFVEGFDDKIFYSFFLPLGNATADHIRLSFGKGNMDRIVSMYYANNMQDRCRAIFIRDSDFDDFLGTLPTGPAFEFTAGYSVENYVFTEASLKRFVKERLAVIDVEYNIDGCLKRYRDCATTLFKYLATLFGPAIDAMTCGSKLEFDAFDIRELAKTFLSGRKLPPIDEPTLNKCQIDKKHIHEESLKVGEIFTQKDPIL